MIEFDSRNYDKYIVASIKVDGVEHDLGMMNEIWATEVLKNLEDAVDDLKTSMSSNVYFEYDNA